MGFYFAWVDPDEDVFEPEHEREDEKVFSVEISESEGEFPGLRIEIENPRVGLLAPSRKRWAWLAEDNGTDVTPLFFGRLVGIPENINAEVITLEFLARPTDWNDQREALAAAMRVFPYYDPVWLNADARADPDAVLEGYTKLWNVDRVTHVVSATDIIDGEGGTVNISGDFMRDSLGITYSDVPLRSVTMNVSVQWTQQGAGTVDLTQSIVDAFHEQAPSSIPLSAPPGLTTQRYVIKSYTGQGLIDDWPEKDDSIGAGWTIAEAEATRVDGKVNEAGEQVVDAVWGDIVSFPVWTLIPKFVARYGAERSKKENVSFTLYGSVQAIVADPGDDETVTISLSSSEIQEFVDDDGATMPIGDLGRRSYFQSERGWKSIENLIARARARMLIRSRAVEVDFDVSWENGLQLSCKKNVFIVDDRLPGGQAAGKVLGYVLSHSGDSGERICRVKIGCTVGRGGVVIEHPGYPTYVNDGYVNGYQVRRNRIVMPIAGEVTFIPPEGIAIDDDGVDFYRMDPERVLLPIEASTDLPAEPAINVVYGPGEQANVVDQAHYDAQAAIAAMNQAYTSIRINIVPLTRGPFEQSYPIEVSSLSIPKTIDMEESDGTDTTDLTV